MSAPILLSSGMGAFVVPDDDEHGGSLIGPLRGSLGEAKTPDNRAMPQAAGRRPVNVEARLTCTRQFRDILVANRLASDAFGQAVGRRFRPGNSIYKIVARGGLVVACFSGACPRGLPARPTAPAREASSRHAEVEMGMARRRLQAFFSGRVQGVGFRYSVKALAAGFEATGIVRNLPDGRVEFTAEGERPELEAFLQAIRESEVGRFIRHEELSWTDAVGQFRGFEIVH